MKRDPKRNTAQPGLDPALDDGPVRKLPEWAREKLIACGRGPLAGQWFTLDDFKTRRLAQERMRALGQARSYGALDYTLTHAEVPHPTYPQVMGALAVYQRRIPS